MNGIELSIEEGTKIICPKCKVLIGEFKRKVRGGEVLKVEDINFFIGDFKNGDYAICPKCGFPFMVILTIGGVIHTEKGWLPIGIPTEILTSKIESYLKKKNRR
jgi:DNA-directed RNA polymerase subunit RPC12/RpoP